jgi:hypothetical protein
MKLSDKNCESVNNGYDLDELSTSRLSTRFNENGGYHKFVFVEAYKEGFLKALELIGNKKFQFTKEELIDLLVDFVGFPHDHNEPRGSISERYVQSLQQNEWDVEIEMVKEEYIWSSPGEGFEDQTYRDWREVPKLDSDGCLILKRKI